MCSSGLDLVWKIGASVLYRNALTFLLDPLYALYLKYLESTYADADPKPGYDSARDYATYRLQHRSSSKPRDDSASVARSCDCEFADITHYISETVQGSIRVTVNVNNKYEVICNLSNSFIFNNLE